MSEMLLWARTKLNVDRRLLLIYCIVYFLWGLGMNWFGTEMQIAKFTYWWQVISCYILYMVPISLLLRNLPFHTQYAYGLIAMGLLEFGGYYFNTSYAFPDNVIERVFGIRNFALGMALFFALYFPLGNMLVKKIYEAVFPDIRKENN
ncbi:hypothetical protein [Muriicola sp. Z0-33]|uniref:hypothetical protein n=1 Tax=Muriicola sp. Z0-33 TaxID=2816957 RepID=UPI0022370119|nr:hypothetical protein [Muriicola sp. Z0-33]MCW5515310.1 hypothetical protein [Muriicola sp. Z0-33]